MSKLSELIAKLCPNGVESGTSSASDSRISRTSSLEFLERLEFLAE